MAEKNRKVDASHRGHKILSFRAQRAVVMLIVEFLLISFSVGVIWNHIDNLGMAETYATLAKIGLGMVEFIVIVLALWELFARDRTLSFICFCGLMVVTPMMLIHAAAVLRYESSGIEQAQTVAAVADAQAKIAAATESARIEAAGREASRLNSIGQRSTARRIANSASVREDGKGAEIVAKVAQDARRKTFLPEWYMKGGMYLVPPMTAFLILMFVMLISKGVISIEDANQDGIPDVLQGGLAGRPSTIAISPDPATARTVSPPIRGFRGRSAMPTAQAPSAGKRAGNDGGAVGDTSPKA